MRRAVIVSIVLVALAAPSVAHGAAVWRMQVSGFSEPAVEENSFWYYLGGFLFTKAAGQRPSVGSTFLVSSSAYAPSPYQTDDTPCVTAAGTRVRPGVVATNWLPLGTILKIDDELFIVEDRMNSRFQGRYLDIWFPSTSAALQHGRQQLEIEIVEYGTPGQDVRVDNTVEAEAVDLDPGIITKTGLRIAAFSRTVGKLLGATANPDQWDVDCFDSEVAAEG